MTNATRKLIRGGVALAGLLLLTLAPYPWYYTGIVLIAVTLIDRWVQDWRTL